MTIIIFIIVLLVVVIVHEYGHFIVARKSGMLVEEFGFGIPPRIWSWKKGETKYSINALPIGGFVKIAGENGEEKGVPKDRQFESKPWYKKSAVLVAGVVCNIILAVALFTISFMIGLPTQADSGTPRVVNVVSKSPAQEAGISVGDTIKSISIAEKNIASIDTDTIRKILQSSPSPVTIEYIHNDKLNTVILIPDIKTKTIGLGIEKIEEDRNISKMPFPAAFNSAIKKTISTSTLVFDTLTGLFTGKVSTRDLMGPVGLAKEIGSAATFGFAYLLAFTATISVNLAVLNIMPFPALDGGRLLVVLLEAIFRRKFSQNIVGIIHTMGFFLLIILMLVLTVSDIRKVL